MYNTTSRAPLSCCKKVTTMLCLVFAAAMPLCMLYWHWHLFGNASSKLVLVFATVSFAGILVAVVIGTLVVTTATSKGLRLWSGCWCCRCLLLRGSIASRTDGTVSWKNGHDRTAHEIGNVSVAAQPVELRAGETRVGTSNIPKIVVKRLSIAVVCVSHGTSATA